MADPPETASDVKVIVEERDIRFIRFWFTDILGHLKSFSINVEELDDAFADGMGFDGSSITGFNAIEESDMIAMPDPRTFALLPWRPQEQGVARMFCDILTPERTPYEGDPATSCAARCSARRPWASRPSTSAPSSSTTCSRTRRSTEVLDEGGYFDLTTLDAGSDVRRETVLALEQLGIHVEYTHHEVGPSQHEIDMRYADALKMADDCMTYRITVKEYAMKYGWHATFMPKPLFGENGSGMHTHMSLFREGRNAFFDADDTYFLSDTGKAFIAGQLKHAREISSVYAQWVNSYKRLVPGYEAPVYVAWSRRNRSALVRVPLYHPGKEQATRMELRCPDPACNPYLTFAALLQAGLEGIEKGYELPEPMEKNLYHLAPDDRRRLGIEQLPETLGEAIELTAESELMLRTLGEHTFNRYVEIKRQEWEDYRVQVVALGARPVPARALGGSGAHAPEHLELHDRAGARALAVALAVVELQPPPARPQLRHRHGQARGAHGERAARAERAHRPEAVRAARDAAVAEVPVEDRVGPEASEAPGGQLRGVAGDRRVGREHPLDGEDADRVRGIPRQRRGRADREGLGPERRAAEARDAHDRGERPGGTRPARAPPRRGRRC